jgi:hypothetical protein
MSDWVLGEFPDEHQLLKAAGELRQQSRGRVETYSPFPLHRASEIVGLSRSRLPILALTFGLAGAAAAYFIQWYTNAFSWALNVGARPAHSAPAFVPITFETGILVSAFSIFFGLWIILELPRPYHPVFEVEAFRSASMGGYWLSVELEPTSKSEELADRLRTLGARQVSVVNEPP